MKKIYEKLSEIEKSGKPAVLCMITKTQGSSPRKAGTKMIVFEDGSIFGTIGGGKLEQKVIKEAVQMMFAKAPKTLKHTLEITNEMTCGGVIEVYLEPVVSAPRLYIFGAGHVGQKLALLAKNLNFDITLIDDREGIFDKEEMNGFKHVNKRVKEAVEELIFDKNTFIAITARKFTIDIEIIENCIKKPFAYFGMLGSKTKIIKTKNAVLKNKDITKEDFDKIHTPIGLKINAQTPEEIGIAVLAEIIEVKNL